MSTTMLRSPMCRQIARTVCNSVVILSLPTSPFADLDDPDALLGAESDSDAFRMKLSVDRSHGLTSTR
jgi:hypothetical protein